MPTLPLTGHLITYGRWVFLQIVLYILWEKFAALLLIVKIIGKQNLIRFLHLIQFVHFVHLILIWPKIGYLQIVSDE